MSPTPLLRRILLTATGITAALAVSVPSAQAVPETAAHEESTEQIELAVQVAQRAEALAELNRRADARDREILGVKAVLARYGYHGDPDAVRVVLPLASYSISAGFGLTGPLWEAEHGGPDLGASSGVTLVAVADATVTDVAYAGPYGLRTILTLPDGTEVWYCHQTTASVSIGQVVEVAQPIGTVGSTGNSTGPHLHLEVRPDGGAPIDPMDWWREAGLSP